ncbi:restriction endonuclease subunit S [Campylobacter mucosalis]|uniref:Type I restriction/modification system, S subunit n=1 Tax=Campylobacter mucosalis CCUG 21559 TaxID=1032067 RepID=A0A6G5QGW4_9BACT|nr:restriction endonuclease subunit S [Campylobacter mucosalis]QCD44918.1 type I restriction/modification system, S subunit [Campylobacter mucosalis CCUG 21559]
MSKINIVRFKDLDRWDVKKYLHSLNSTFPIVELKNFIIENKNKVKPFEFPKQNFDILGVNNRDGVYFNETLLGSHIKQPYCQVRSGEIFYNPYRINVGSIGIVPDEFDLKYTSPAYVVFSTDETKLLAKFLVFVLKSKKFNDFLRANTKGSVRQNLSFQALCELQIPLPPLEIQNKIVADIENIRAKIKALQEEEQRLKNEIDIYIYIALGLRKKQKVQKQKVFVMRFKDLTRWDLTYNQNVNFDETNKSEPKYPLVRLGDICETNIGLTYNPSDISKDNVGVGVLRSNNINDGIINYDNLIYVKNTNIKQSKIAKKGDLIMCVRNGSANLVGKTAMVNKNNISFGAFMAIIRSKYNKFIYYVLQTDMLRDNIFGMRSQGINQISQSDIKNFKIPLPPLKIQEKIVADIENLNGQILNAQTEILSLKGQETAILESCF